MSRTTPKLAQPLFSANDSSPAPARIPAAPSTAPLLHNLRLAGRDLDTVRGWITPEIAQDWFATQIRNRTISGVTITSYAIDMLAGRWRYNGEPIKFDVEGHLIDGQQRMLALASLAGKTSPHFPSGVRIEVLVVRSLPPETQDSMDQGRRRQAGAQLGLLGYSNGMYLAALVRVLRMYETGTVLTRRTKMTNSAIDEYVSDPIGNRPAEIELANRLFSYIPKIQGAKPAVAGAMGVLFYRASNRDTVLEFFSSLAKGADLPGDSPILALRNRLARHVGPDNKLGDRDTIGMFIRTWNCWVNGERAPRTLLPIHRGGWTAEDYNIVGLAPYTGNVLDDDD